MFQSRKFYNNYRWLVCLLCCALLVPQASRPPAYAATLVLPLVSYDSSTNTVAIGSNSGAVLGSEAITIPELAATLTTQGHSDLVLDQGNGAWLVKANVIISPTARLEATSPSISWLRLDSPPLQPLTLTALRGGHLLIDGIQVTSWDSVGNRVDDNVANERSYLLALAGGRLDILHSDVGYLGWTSGEGSGLSWRKRLNDADVTTGATGRLEDSQIHDNYFGMYSFAAYGLTILRNQVFNNLYYGIDPHDDSEGFEVAYNHVHHNGKHGIIFSRLCQNNVIHDNEVNDNANHGIMLDRGTDHNIIRDNLVYNNQDGIAIFQSSNNLIEHNSIHHNGRGVRINATFDTTDVYDGLAVNNQVINNQIADSSEHGIYLYARADRNIIRGNSIVRSGVTGMYMKTGGNRVENNIVSDGVIGVSIVGGDAVTPLPALQPLESPGNNNVVISTTVTANSDVGLRILGGANNRIGPALNTEKGNRIEQNGKDGVSIGDAISGAISTGNQVISNTIRGNTRHGVLVTDSSSARNRISHNSITSNGQLGIKISPGAQDNILPPQITTLLADGQIGGTTRPNATVEIFTDPGTTAQVVVQMVTASLHDEQISAASTDQALAVYAATDLEGATYLGSTKADGNGAWGFHLPANQSPQQVTVVAIDPTGNTSAFGNLAGNNGINAFYSLTTDDNGQPMIQVTGPGAIVTLADIQAGLGNANNNLVQNLGNQHWQLNANLFVGPDVTLDLSPAAGVSELRLRSQNTTTVTASAVGLIDYGSFVYIRAHNGTLNLDGVKVYSWDPVANKVDEDYSNGRAYLLAKYDAVMNINNAELSYLGSADGESYGVSWRDTNAPAAPAILRTRVTGRVTNSLFHHNYYGIYTFQASNMLFQGNQFYNNVRYGFDPHDFSHDVLVETNLSYNNGAHGFIVSRGCNNFTFRNNKAYNNLDPTSNQAHGFMLDPGSPSAIDPQAPSYENLLENNEAYGNEGFGLRVLGSIDNQISGNNFHDNQVGISLDEASTANTLNGNQIAQNTLYGVILREKTDGTTLTDNQIHNNGSHGLFVRSSNNLINHNLIQQNVQAGVALLPATGMPNLQANQLISNTISNNGESGIDLRKTTQSLLQENRIVSNGVYGVYLSDNANQNTLLHNVIQANHNFGIRANGLDTYANTWSQNQIFANQAGGISLALGANGNISAPMMLTVVDKTISGKTLPGAKVEIFADLGAQGQYQEGEAVAGNDGSFSLTILDSWQSANLTAITIDSNGNASVFSAAVVSPATPTPIATPTSTATATATPTPTSTTPNMPVPTNTSTPTPTLTNTPGPGTGATLTPIAGTYRIHLPIVRR